MTRSIFDPTGPDMERARGNRFMGEQGQNASLMPASLQPKTHEDKSFDGAPEAATPEEAAERLDELTRMAPDEVEKEEEQAEQGGEG